MHTLLTIPNLLTCVRMLLAPFIMHCITRVLWFRAFLLFTGAAITDYLDGFFARLLHQKTTIGSWLDPLADKLLMIGLLIICAMQGYISWVPVILLTFKELLLMSAVTIGYCIGGVKIIVPALGGKIAMSVSVLYFELFFLSYAFHLSWAPLWATYAIWVVVLCHLWACMHYLYNGIIQWRMRASR